ncbi:MAG: c-type cytochrome biogenesis protein CcsB [Deltaproteobacteria bacterium]|nr:MAG: c-type cytochrome biogenesis protein CcsB [Deltaproteobacteria bacterium]
MFSSTYLYNTSSLLYVIVLFGYLLNIGIKSSTLKKIFTTILSIGFIIQSIGIALRWLESGLVEVHSFLASSNEIQSRLHYLVLLTQHPPWSDLYEIMIFMSWGIIFVSLICEMKWENASFINIFSLLFSLVALGLASLNKGITKPLVPALKSWWIMIHVISASIAYAAGIIAAISSLLFLISSKSISTRSLLIGSLSTFVLFLLLLMPDYYSSWDLALLFVIFIGCVLIMVIRLSSINHSSIMPSQTQLDHISYSNILISFSFTTVVLITGCLWAHYAWGRYWGWDPKETGALLIWLTYAFYLHTRLNYEWSLEKSSLISILGFFIIIAGFLGVNLGWFSYGLHSYGRS